MPERRLVSLLRRLVAERFGPGTIGGALIQKGEVVQVRGTGELTVALEGKTVVAHPVTDEFYRVGTLVWVSNTSEGFIVHGGVR